MQQEAFFPLLATGQLHIMERSMALMLDSGPPQTYRMNSPLAYTNLCFICNKQTKNYNFSLSLVDPHALYLEGPLLGVLTSRVREGLREKRHWHSLDICSVATGLAQWACNCSHPGLLGGFLAVISLALWLFGS